MPTKMKPTGDRPVEETPAEMAERVHQVISVIADAVLKALQRADDLKTSKTAQGVQKTPQATPVSRDLEARSRRGD